MSGAAARTGVFKEKEWLQRLDKKSIRRITTKFFVQQKYQ